MNRHSTFRAVAIGALVAATIVPVSAQSASAVQLEQIVAFDNPADPWLSEKSDRIFDTLWTKASANVAVPGIGLTPVSVSNDRASGWTRNHVALSGKWHGLAMTGFSLNGVPNSGIGAYVLHFAESPARVVGKLSALGYPVAAVGREVRTGDESCGAKLLVDGKAQSATFTISFAC